MAIAPGFQLRQTHNLVMTPQLRLAINIMQMSGIEVAALVEEELQRNPLLVAGQTEDLPPEATSPDQSIPETPLPASALPDSGNLPGPDDAPLDTDYAAEARSGGFDDGYNTDGAPFDRRKGTAILWEGQEDNHAATGQPPLHERLSAQLRMTPHLSHRQRLIGACLIARLDLAGRLDCAPGEIAAILAVSTEEVEIVRTLMMTTFEPIGLFACSLKECLAAQLTAQNRFDPAISTLLDHLDLIAGRHYSKLRALCDVDEDDFADMLAELRRLDPKPGFEPDLCAVSTVVPDVIFRRSADGLWRVELNTDAMPRLRLDNGLQACVAMLGQKDDRAFVQTQLSQASGLIRALDQRGRTLWQVSSEIMRHQHDFTERGVPGLRPLTLRDIAATTGLHESTVSRVTSGKYIATPRGVFELKYFFTTAVRNMHGSENHSAEAIRFKIRKMVDAETRGSILSDDDIMRRLRKEGIDIARRTVAKYRDTLHIASSVQRKREKAASA
ncbi:RNA polymerase factor sigma-54 [Acetobacter fallax]|uniref:RNA polymerase sigma-54 factor n=1 Tax=Acetobacter fallax TaxID=1737473 RepID=A0ABX0KEX5_9PROT|nr:RNA polymerase factor sigma-54 [Acetobacter fallax]NHO32492.1 RNA polymerase factor sigma-54 [Acetobacter fallax]NHO36052.1 RNA polymerase factor sigma-54 [Acetobacter fallax]